MTKWYQNGPPTWYSNETDEPTLKEQLRDALEARRQKNDQKNNDQNDEPGAVEEPSTAVALQPTALPARPSIPPGAAHVFSPKELQIMEHDAWSQTFKLKLQAFLSQTQLQAADELTREHTRRAIALWREINEQLEQNRDLPGIEDIVTEVMDTFMKSNKRTLSGWL
jgi:hypothetical protein